MNWNRKKLSVLVGVLVVSGIMVFVFARVAAARGGSAGRSSTELVPVKELRDARAGASAVPGSSVDLLDLVQCAKDALAGAWGFQERALITSEVPYGRLQFPCIPPEEYDLGLKVTRKKGYGSLNLGFVYGGRQGMVMIDGNDGRTLCLYLTGGPDLMDNKTRSEGQVFRWNEPRNLILMVRASGVKLAVEGEPLIVWNGKPADLAFPPGWNVLDPKALFIGSSESVFRVDSFILTPVKGSPMLLRKSSTGPG